MTNKKISFLALFLIFFVSAYSQNITNTIGNTGNYIVRDATKMFMNIRQSDGCIGIGTNTYDVANPEKLLIDCGTTNSVNAVYAKGTINSYLQFNIRNLSNGSQASSDLVATANNGTETSNYMNVGINGSGYQYQSGNPLETGKANDCYLFAAGNDLYIVNNNPLKDILFLAGGSDTTKQRMKIFHGGNVTIGFAAATSYKLAVNGSIYAIQYWQPSDIRLKHDINTLSNVMGNLLKLRAVTYKYNDDAEEKTQIGFIAQEMEEVFPEFVTTNEDGLKGINYANVSAVLLEGIKEQQEQINNLDSKINNLESRLSSLENREMRSGIQPAGFINADLLWLAIPILGIGFILVIKKRKIS
ncbi:MAG: tail fiber domain-containing protein [Ignavibacteria bacterium]